MALELIKNDLSEAIKLLNLAGIEINAFAESGLSVWESGEVFHICPGLKGSDSPSFAVAEVSYKPSGGISLLHFRTRPGEYFDLTIGRDKKETHYRIYEHKNCARIPDHATVINL
jgi:hypothetical protein